MTSLLRHRRACLRSLMLSATSMAALVGLVVGCVPEGRVGGRPLERPGRRSPPTKVDYVMIAADALAPGAKRYRQYRVRSGHRVALATVGSLAPSGTPRVARVAAIKAFIRKHAAPRDRRRPFFVLLLGDAEAALPTATPAGSRITTDNPYADVEGDYLPELALGRISARSNAELDAIRLKVERYERHFEPGPHNRRVVLFASRAGYSARVDRMIEKVAMQLLDRFGADYDVKVTWAAPHSPVFWPPTDFSAEVDRQLNAGALLGVYVGHGATDSLTSFSFRGRRYPIWKQAGFARRLRLKRKPPIMLLVACSLGAFDNQEGLSEGLLRLPLGPPAIIAATEVSHPYPNAVLLKEVSDLLGHERRPATAGELHRRAKIRLVRQQDVLRQTLDWLAAKFMLRGQQSTLWRSHVQMYVLLGDPALQIRYPKGRIQLRLSAAVARPGQRLGVKLRIPGLERGQALLTLETRRSQVRARILPIPLDADPRRDAVIRENHRRANDKVVQRMRLAVAGGRAAAVLEIPARLPPGSYVIKAYAHDQRMDAVGHRHLELRAAGP